MSTEWTPRPGQIIRNRQPYPGEPSYLVERVEGGWVHCRAPGSEVWDGWGTICCPQFRLEAVREFYEVIGGATQ